MVALLAKQVFAQYLRVASKGFRSFSLCFTRSSLAKAGGRTFPTKSSATRCAQWDVTSDAFQRGAKTVRGDLMWCVAKCLATLRVNVILLSQTLLPKPYIFLTPQTAANFTSLYLPVGLQQYNKLALVFFFVGAFLSCAPLWRFCPSNCSLHCAISLHSPHF